jgi:hypothetical protein
MKTVLSFLSSSVLFFGLCGNASAAYVTYFGEDLTDGFNFPLLSTPNALSAEASFKSSLIGASTETFEGQTTGALAPLELTFPGAGTATLVGGDGEVAEDIGANSVGRYSVPQPGSFKYWEVTAGGGGDFTVQFSQAIAAFGFYGIDIGDFGGQLTLELLAQDGSTVLSQLTVDNTIGSEASTDGSVLYFGAIAGSPAEDFWAVRFNTTTGGGDFFAFDNFTIAGRDQLVNPTPLPGTLALMGLGLVVIGGASRRRV